MDSQPASELLAKLKRTVGLELVFRAPDEMGRASFRKYALAMTITVLAINLFGAAIRERLDPKLRGRGGAA